jgi:hypothetical protein
MDDPHAGERGAGQCPCRPPEVSALTVRTRLRAALATTLAATVLAGCASTPSTGPVSQPSTAQAVTPTATPSSTPTPSAALVLGPDGYGSLVLGMSVADAETTGLMTPMGQQQTGCDSSTKLTGTPAGATDQQGVLFFSDNLGLAAIDAYPGIATPEGIAIGSTKQQVQAAYPDWKTFPETGGRGYAKASATSVYRIVVAPASGTVTELTLQLTNQDCYE